MRECIKKFCCKRKKTGRVVAKGRSRVKRNDCFFTGAHLRANRKALRGGSEEVIQWPHNTLSGGRECYGKQRRRALCPLSWEGGGNTVIWQLESTELSKFLSPSFYFLCGTSGEIICWIRGEVEYEMNVRSLSWRDSWVEFLILRMGEYIHQGHTESLPKWGWSTWT